jgi:hypothetical protein
MDTHAVQRLGRPLAAAAALLAGACADGPLVGPDPTGGASAARSTAQADAPARGARSVELVGDCARLQAPAGSTLAFHAYARGVQIYRWTGSSWAFDGPSALLSADAAGRSTVGTHYAGPKWEHNGGGIVAATVKDRCTPDAGAIPWLSLNAVSDGGPGAFKRVTFIQRVNTVGGKEPTFGGSHAGQVERVPYAAEYYFYR